MTNMMANSAAAVGKMAEADNGQIMAVLAGIQQSSQDAAQAMKAIAAELGNLRGGYGRCCCCCGGCCCGGGNVPPAAPEAGIGANIAYVMMTDSSGDVTKLTSCHRPLRSQAEVDAVDVIVFLGGLEEGCSLSGKFTLDGFSMPGQLLMDMWATNSYPCTFLRKQDRSGWMSLTRRDVMNGDRDYVDLYVWGDKVDGIDYAGKKIDINEELCCHLYEHNCRGKVFTMQLAKAEE